MEYTIAATTAGADDLVKVVNLYLEDGWQPVGGMTIETNRREMIWFQPLVRKIKR